MLLYCPAAHLVHDVAPLLTTPVPSPISAIDPAAHVEHATVDDAEYRPEPHAVHDVAPDDANVSVTSPGVLHAEHATVDMLLYCPAAHAVQLTAPADPNVSVYDPAEHTMQLV